MDYLEALAALALACVWCFYSARVKNEFEIVNCRLDTVIDATRRLELKPLTIESLKRTDIRPGDTLVLKLRTPISPETHARLAETLKKTFPQAGKVLVMDGPQTLEVMRPAAEPVEPPTFFVDDEPTEDERRKIREAFEKSFGLHAKKAATLDDLKPKFSTHEPEQAPTTIAEVSDIPLGLCSSPEAAIEKLRAIVAKITKSPVESLDVQTVGKFGGNFAYAGRAKLYDSTSRNETTAAKGEGRCEPEIEARR